MQTHAVVIVAHDLLPAHLHEVVGKTTETTITHIETSVVAEQPALETDPFRPLEVVDTPLHVMVKGRLSARETTANQKSCQLKRD